MKKILLILSIALILPLQVFAQEKYNEGEHYKIIAEQVTEKKEVLEFFSFWCRHCFNFEPIVKDIKTKLANDVQFKKVHVNFMGSTSKQNQDDATKVMMVANALKKSDVLNQLIFKHIHVAGLPIAGLNDLRNIYILNGIEPEQFDKMVSDPAVNSMMQDNENTIKQYYKYISSVPSFIVNGKYQATFTRDMTSAEMADLVVFLSNKK